ncbi:MAG TPA: hypothetical protein VNY78_04350 [Edaphobacter sp.]|nr:hypothetical protein [Edaphobacter sp.]
MPFPAGLVGPGIPDARLIALKGSPEVALNQKVKNLIQKLGEAIHESVSESEDIAGVVKNIREQGFDVLLMLEATIGLNEVEPDAVSEEAEDEAADGPFTRNDLTFLKSLRISLTEENASDDVHDV